MTAAAQERLIDSNGYVMILDRDHPLAYSCTGRVPEHRRVMYNRYGQGVQSCFWCGAKVSWDDNLQIDHLNDCRTDNRLDNLVFVCTHCNTRRGHVSCFLRHMRPEAFGVFVEVARSRLLVREDVGKSVLPS